MKVHFNMLCSCMKNWIVGEKGDCHTRGEERETRSSLRINFIQVSSAVANARLLYSDSVLDLGLLFRAPGDSIRAKKNTKSRGRSPSGQLAQSASE